MSAPAGSQAMIGAVLSARYRLLSLLGEGAMGAVFEAQDLQGQNRYAIKLLRPEYAYNTEILSRFHAEAEASSRLVHPNIARCFGHATAEEGSPYLIMELLDGSSLTSYLKPGLAYEAQYAVPIVRGVLAALAEAHRQGIVHRDIKPDNVFLVRNSGGPPLVKVLDFGIAKIMDAAGGMMAKTRTGMLLGTPSYMAPEQIRDAKSVDPRADLWSAGVIFYELLTGREAFAAPSELAKLTMILTEEVLAVDHAKPHLLPWRPFFAQALARDVHRRFGSAAEMDRAMADADHAARAAGIGAPLAKTTDMSPELPRGVSQKSAPPQIQVLPTPVPPADPVSRPIFDSTLKAGDVPVIEQPGARVPVWLLFLVALACLAIGIAVGVFVGRG